MIRNRCGVADFFAIALLCAGCGLIDPKEKKAPAIEHGIVDFYSVEGVAPDVSSADDLVDVLGSPALKNANATHEYYYYPNLGLKFVISVATDIVAGAYIHGKGWGYNVNGQTGTFSRYSYPTEKGIVLDSTSTMDDVVRLYGTPAAQATLNNKDTTGSYPRFFKYSTDRNGKTGNMEFYFWGTSANDYAGKKVIQIFLY